MGNSVKLPTLRAISPLADSTIRTTTMTRKANHPGSNIIQPALAARSKKQCVAGIRQKTHAAALAALLPAFLISTWT
jgi:hypothetical protein